MARLKSSQNESTNNETAQDLKEFIQNLAKSLTNETDKTSYFLDICKNLPNDKFMLQILVEESLINKNDFSAFYEILIQRSEGLGKYEHDYDFVSLLETTWDSGDAELLLDSENDFKIDEPNNERLEWQKIYLEFLLETRNLSVAAKVIVEIENSLKGHYPRPIWLRLARFRAHINQNKSSSELSEMMKFIGIVLSPNAPNATLPNLERLNETIKILKNENQIDLILVLQEAFFSRQIALGQFNSANFIGLANIEFQKGDQTTALKLLKIMTDFSSEESRAELDALPVIKKFAEKENLPFEEQNELTVTDSIKLAAEISAENGFFAESVSYREKLTSLSPDDARNKIELARLLANVKTSDDSSNLLLQIITDKHFNRSARWQALIVLTEIVGADENLWQKIINDKQGLEQQDAEMWNALKAASFYQIGKIDEAIKLLQENDFTVQLKFLKAIFEKNSGRDEQALRTFAELSESTNEIDEIFGFYESAPNFQLINLYLKTGKIRAALSFAKKREILKMIKNNDSDLVQIPDSKFKKIELLTGDLKFSQNLQLLENLSKAAQSIGEFSQSIEFEKAKSTFFKLPEETKDSLIRLEDLQQKLAQANENQTNSLVVNDQLISDF